MDQITIQSNEIEIVSINTPIPYEKNMHVHSDEQIDRLIKLIEYQGFRNPLVLQRGTNRIACGHGRLIAAKRIGMKTVPVIYQDFESEAQFYSYVVSDNAIGKNEWASLDLGKINTEILELGPDFDVENLGIMDFTIEPVEKFDDKKPDTKTKPNIKELKFLVSNEQNDLIDDALSKAKLNELCDDELNDDINGNALTAIVKRYTFEILRSV